MSDFDTTEKLNVLLKSAFAVTSTNETTPWYNEKVVPFNNYVEADDVFLKSIPQAPVWGESINPSEYGLNYSDFHNGDNNTNSYGNGNIQIDSTGVLAKFSKLKLEAIYDTSAQSK
jgi:hypothetical protein